MLKNSTLVCIFVFKHPDIAPMCWKSRNFVTESCHVLKKTGKLNFSEINVILDENFYWLRFIGNFSGNFYNMLAIEHGQERWRYESLLEASQIG